MNTLIISFIYCAIQITLLGLVSIAIYAWTNRRGPSLAAAFLNSLMLIFLALTPLALIPLPSWWTWNSPLLSQSTLDDCAISQISETAQDHAHKELEGDSPLVGVTALTAQSRFGVSTDFLRKALAALQPSTAHSADEWPWPKTLSLLILIGWTSHFLRLALGLWGVHNLAHRADPLVRPQADPLLNLLELLRTQMNIPYPIELRISASLATAATVGWRRPMILLPRDWPTWSLEEQRAVLAHELAHIRRSDYAAGLVARLCVALHFYHPLVRWLARRLHLQQELAADALGADHAGGRASYLKALAQMALRNDARPPAWLVRTFLPSPGTLLRRIQMLKRTDSFIDKPVSTTRRIIMVSMMGLLAVALTTLRSPLSLASEETPIKPETPKPIQSSRTPFDLSYVPADAQGIIALRPSALLNHPELRKYVEAMNSELDKTIVEAGGRNGLGFKLEDVEQVVGHLVLRKGDKKKGVPSSLSISHNLLIRMNKPHDWASIIRNWFGDVHEVHIAGCKFYQLPKRSPLGVQLGVMNAYAVLPDPRTIVILGKPELPTSKKELGIAWNRVNEGVFAIAYDTRDGTEKGSFPEPVLPEDAVSAGISSVLYHPCLWFVGVNDKGRLTMDVIAVGENEKVSAKVEHAVNAAQTLLHALIRLQMDRQKESLSKDVLSMLPIVLDMIGSAKIERTGNTVHCHSQAKWTLTDFMAAFMRLNEIGIEASKAAEQVKK